MVRASELHSVGEKVGSREAQGEEPGELGSQPSLGLGFSPVLVTAEGAVSLPFPCNEGSCQSSRSFLEESLRPPALPHRPGVDAAPGLLAAPGSGPPARPAPPALCTHRNLLEPPAPPPRPSLPPPSSLCVLRWELVAPRLSCTWEEAAWSPVRLRSAPRQVWPQQPVCQHQTAVCLLEPPPSVHSAPALSALWGRA